MRAVPTPRVSIVIPTYNRVAYIVEAIRSVQLQSVADWELIVVDDGSTDGTSAALEQVARGDPRIRMIRNDRTPGPAGARNAGLRQVRSEFVAFLDSDDVWSPAFLERQLQRLADDHATGLAAADYWMVDKESGYRQSASAFLLETMLPWWESMPLARQAIPCAEIRRDISTIARREAVLSNAIGGFLWIAVSAVVLRLRTLDKIGGFNEALARTEDLDLWLRINRSWAIAYTDLPLATYDITGRNEGSGPRYIGHAAGRRHSAYSERVHHIGLLKRIARMPELNAAQRAFLRDRLGALHHEAVRLAGRGRPAHAMRHCAAALWHRPGRIPAFARSPLGFFRNPG